MVVVVIAEVVVVVDFVATECHPCVHCWPEHGSTLPTTSPMDFVCWVKSPWSKRERPMMMPTPSPS